MTSDEKSERTAYEPLHPSMRTRLYPEYVKLHDEILQYAPPPVESYLRDPIKRLQPAAMVQLAPRPVEVGKIFDKTVGNFQVRVFIPQGEAPGAGWPCLVWYHGGGWALGSIESDVGMLTHICKSVKCAVVHVDYRHAPLYPFPAAADDAFAGLLWAVSPGVAAEVKIDVRRVVIGGPSSGANIAAVAALKAAEQPNLLPAPLAGQLLIVPVIDNTATVATVWSTSRHAPGNTPKKLTWYRSRYLQNEADAFRWEASPCFAPQELLAASPPTFLGVAECDLVAPEGLAHGDRLRALGVETEVKVWEGAPHLLVLFAGVHKPAQGALHDMCTWLARLFGTQYDRDLIPIAS